MTLVYPTRSFRVAEVAWVERGVAYNAMVAVPSVRGRASSARQSLEGKEVVVKWGLWIPREKRSVPGLILAVGVASYFCSLFLAGTVGLNLDPKPSGIRSAVGGVEPFPWLMVVSASAGAVGWWETRESKGEEEESGASSATILIDHPQIHARAQGGICRY